MRTTTERPVRWFTTRIFAPKGRVRCAAVRALVLKRSPLAVRRPWKPGPYQDAMPDMAFPFGAATAVAGARTEVPSDMATAAATRTTERMSTSSCNLFERQGGGQEVWPCG